MSETLIVAIVSLAVGVLIGYFARVWDERQ